jgi:mRNA-degrading endonuclease RelE of RelBE toxin-antitoxin system
MELKLRRRLTLVIFAILIFLQIIGFSLNSIYWKVQNKNSEHFDLAEFSHALKQVLEDMTNTPLNQNVRDSLLAAYLPDQELIPRNLHDSPKTLKFLNALTRHYHQYRTTLIWSKSDFLRQIQRRLQAELLLPVWLVWIIGILRWIRLSLYVSIGLLVFLDVRSIFYACLQKNIPATGRLIFNIYAAKNPMSALDKYSDSYKKYRYQMDRNAMGYDRISKYLEELSKLSKQIDQKLSDYYDLTEDMGYCDDIYENTKKFYDQHASSFPTKHDLKLLPKHGRDLQLLLKQLRRIISEIDLKIKQAESSQRPILSTSKQPQRQWYNPKKRRHKKQIQQETSKKDDSQSEPKKEAEFEWQVFFIAQADGQPIPLQMTNSDFRSLLKTYRPNINPTRIFKGINHLLSMTPQQRLEVPYIMVVFYKGFRKYRLGKARIFFTIDEESHRFTFSVYHRTDLEKLGHDYV